LGKCAGIRTVALWRRWWKVRRGEKVRILVTFSMNPEKGDQLIKEGRIGETMGSILDELQPEAAYFTDVDGTRGGFLVVNMEDASQIPAITEPLFLQVGATVHMQPVMTPEDLRGPAGDALEQMAQRYG
jgi:hypothetical protein